MRRRLERAGLWGRDRARVVGVDGVGSPVGKVNERTHLTIGLCGWVGLLESPCVCAITNDTNADEIFCGQKKIPANVPGSNVERLSL